MTHDHEALRLAVAALDFELSPQERAGVQAGLTDCAECADMAMGHEALDRLLARLPVRDASPHVRERVLRSALVPPSERRWPVLLAAAAMLAMLIGAAAGAGAFRDRQALVPAIIVPSESEPALGDVDTEASPVPADQGSPRPGEGPPGAASAGPPLPPDTLATVVSGRLRIRSEPRVADDSIKFEPLLEVGDRLLILDGPIVANDYAWYLVTAWRPGAVDATWPLGWVARGDHDGSPWLRATADPCPTGPITMAVVIAMVPQERVACLGDQRLRLRSFVATGGETMPCSPDVLVACVDGPTWLAGSGGWTAALDVTSDTGSIGGPSLAVVPGGPVSPEDLPSSGMVDIDGAFDHPAAGECRPGAVGQGAQPLTPVAARWSCRSRFVVTGVRVDPAYPIRGEPAVTVSRNVRVRSDPGLTSVRHELLAEGTPVWVLEGPVVAADYEWFQVIVPSVDTGDGVPRVGWVAASDHGAEPWLGKRTLDCPEPGSLDVADLARLTTSGAGDTGLGCFGSTTLRFRAGVQLQCGLEGRPGWDMKPGWLAANATNQLALRDGETVVLARLDPRLQLSQPCDGADDGTWSIEGHFDDSAALSCDATLPGSEQRPDLRMVAVFWCRTTLVVDRLVPAP